MKVLTLTQPWATLVAIGAKRIETRSWGLSHRLPLTLAIHAAKGLGPVGGKRGLHELVRNRPFWDVLSVALDVRDSLAIVDRLPLGAIVAVCELTAIARIDYYEPQRDDADQWCGHFLNLGSYGQSLPDEPERSFGDYSVGRFAWLLADIRALEPIPAKGALGLWEMDTATEQAVIRQLT